MVGEGVCTHLLAEGFTVIESVNLFDNAPKHVRQSVSIAAQLTWPTNLVELSSAFDTPFCGSAVTLPVGQNSAAGIIFGATDKHYYALSHAASLYSCAFSCFFGFAFNL